MNENVMNLLKTGLPFGVILGICGFVIGGFLFGIIVLILSAIIFGGMMSWFIWKQTTKFKMIERDIVEGDMIVYSGGANHFINKESVGGWLILTPDKIVFQSHKVNVQRHNLIIDIRDIKEAKEVNTLKFVPNGLLIVGDNEEKNQFVVNNRKIWINKISERINLDN